MVRLHTVRIPCTDLHCSEKFYAKLFGVESSFGSMSQGYIGFVLENVSVLLEPNEPGEFEAGRYLGLSFEVRDIESFHERLKGEVQFISPPQVESWGGIMAHIADSSGNMLSIVEMADDA